MNSCCHNAESIQDESLVTTFGCWQASVDTLSSVRLNIFIQIDIQILHKLCKTPIKNNPAMTMLGLQPHLKRLYIICIFSATLLSLDEDISLHNRQKCQVSMQRPPHLKLCLDVGQSRQFVAELQSSQHGVFTAERQVSCTGQALVSVHPGA